MKKLLSILIIFLSVTIACVTADQNVKSYSSSYDGIWEGYADTSEGRFEIKMQIKNGVMKGFVDDTKIKGYVKSDTNLFISPFYITGATVTLETNFMSPERIEGNIVAEYMRDKWFVVKK